jgi:hypothetical protein
MQAKPRAINLRQAAVASAARRLAPRRGPIRKRRRNEIKLLMEGDMQAGLLWYDSEPSRSVAAKAAAAAERFQEKFGVVPDVCYVSAKALKDGELVVPFHNGQLRLVPANNILVNHFWIGLAGS